MAREHKDSWRDYIQPVGMATGSFLNLMGAVIHQCTSETDRENPFYYAAMLTSAMYVVGNSYATRQVYNTHTQNELNRRRLSLAPLTEVKMER